MHVDEVKGAAVAGVEEVTEPGQSRGAAAVGDGRGGELGLAGKGLHVVFIDGSGVGGREVGLAGAVGFVGGEEPGDAAGADEVLDLAHPVAVLQEPVDGEGGDKGDGAVEVDAVAGCAGGAPVRAPAGVFAAFEEVTVGGLGVVVVDETAFIGGADAPGYRSCAQLDRG